MSDKKTIVVFGATGAQGGGLVKAILEDSDGGFFPRAVTRNGNSDKAMALKDLGAQLVEADLDDYDSLTKALEGAYGAYCVTNFWEHFSAEKEMQQAESLAKACKATGVKHVVWSTLEDTREFVPLDDNRMPTLQGKWKVPHFDGKGASDHFFADNGVPTTYILTSFYWDNFVHFGSGPQKGADGKYAITFPLDDKPMSGIAAEDIGRCAYGIFKGGEQWIGKRVGIAGEHISAGDMAAQMSKALGVDVAYNNVTPEVYRGFGFPGADDLGNMFQFYRDFADYFTGFRDISVAKSLNPKLQDFSQWLAANSSKIPLG
ncbi:MAG: NmrA/HSCARG family protein [Armatimonadetes bacterium]|nr:NmrA/HSCARG family protein [Armatimonadota bacterium]